MGRDGWLGIGWPEEYGGQARGELEQFIFTNEAWRAGVPIPFLTINTVGKTIMEFGSEEQKEKFLPKILAGECHFSIGYTEPGAGTDLASLRTTAVKDGDEWVINGQKIYTSLASYADYIWLAARTDPEAPKHKGISIFLVPDHRSRVLVDEDPHDGQRVDDVDVLQRRPRRRRRRRLRREPGLGPHHEPAQLRTDVAGPAGDGRALLRRGASQWAQDTKLPDGRRVIDQEWVQLNLARVRAKTEYLKLINWKVCHREDEPGVSPARPRCSAPSSSPEAYRLLLEVVGPGGQLRQGEPDAALAGQDRARHARHADPHVRRRHQRGAAGSDRPVRPRPAPSPSTLMATGGASWISR